MMSPASAYKLNYQKQEDAFQAEQVIHNRSWSLDYSYGGAHLYGISPLKAARRSVTMSNDGREAQTWMLKNMGSKGLLAMDVLGSGLKETPSAEQFQKIKDDFNDNNRGIEKAGKVGVTVGKYQWFQMGMSSVDLSIIESQKWSMADICKVYGISPILLASMDAATYSNYREAKKAAISMAVIPLLTSVRDSLNQGLLKEFKDGDKYLLDFDTTVYSELQEDRSQQATYLEKAYWLTLNEKRIEMGYGELDDENMKKVYLGSSLSPLEQVNATEVLNDVPMTGDY
jgi:HK97 family phage portal protein